MTKTTTDLYKQTPLGLIPSDWEVKRFDEFAPLQRGFDLPVDDIVEGEYPVVFSNGILKYHNEFKAKAPGVVTGRSGTIGKVTFVNKDYWPHNTSLWVTDFKGNDALFVFYYINFIGLDRFGSGSGVPTLNRNDVHSFKIIIPPLPEQKAIAHVLSTADAAIQTIEKLIAQKEQRKKWLMQQLLTGKKRLKGFSGEWKEMHLEYFIKEHKQKPTTEDNYEVLTSAKSGLMKQTDYYGDNRITNRDDADYNVIPPSHLTYRSRSDDGLFTFNKNDLGITGLISGYYPVFTIKNGDLDFILMYMNYYKQKLTKYAIGTSQLVLAMNALKEAKFVLPEHEEQTAIAEVLQTTDKEINLLKTKATKLREQKKGLMQQLLTGKKRLNQNFRD